MKRISNPNESHTWLILTTLILTVFFYQWNVLYSLITTISCNTFNIYWHANTGIGSPFQLSILTFMLIGAWSLIEIVLACFGQVRDRFFTILINVFIIMSIGLCLYSLYRLDKTIDIYPLLYEQEMNNENSKRALVSYQKRNCVASRVTEQ